ncbi:TIGR03089 family protein [Nocardioides rotundus]|uniref:TIGR03089 family protein n=1 Tax=Nocardioides rotundus TaxID=1774216 RepID=UPI001CBD1CCF|nr:TIGR03089 family protein [Nocardioides rotundus]UAL28627.1 TIGR03089 family protein [Nocardioides rotundus]
MPVFHDILQPLLRADPGRPLVTFYDSASGERTELSVATYANWVAKGASLLADESGLERGQRLLVDLPTHWLGPVFLGAAWTVGLEVVWPGEEANSADAVVCGPDGVERYGDLADRLPVLASALLPLGVRFPTPPGGGIVDIGVEIWGQPDAFTPWDPPLGDDLAVTGQTHDQLWEAAAASPLAHGDRLLAESNPASPSGLGSFTGPLARSGSLVLAVNADREQLQRIRDDERVTGSGGQPALE